MTSRSRTSRLLAILCVLVLLLAACGEDEPAASPEPQDPATDEPEPTEPEETEETEDPGEEEPTEPAEDYTVPDEYRRLALVGSSEGGGGHLWWVAASQLFNNYLDMETTVRPGGTRENALLMEAGEVQASTVSPVDLVEATEDPDALDDTVIRTLWAKFNVGFKALVPEDSDAQVFSDLAGKRVAIGIAGGGESNLFLEAMACVGLDENDFNLQYTGKGESVDAYNDGVIDAWAGQGPNPTPQFVEAFEGRGARLLPLDDEIVECLADTGRYIAAEVPADTYSGQTEPVASVNQWFYAAVHEDLPEDLVYHMARVLDEHHDELMAAYAGAGTSTAENTAENIGFELHPGTERYLQETGNLD